MEFKATGRDAPQIVSRYFQPGFAQGEIQQLPIPVLQLIWMVSSLAMKAVMTGTQITLTDAPIQAPPMLAIPAQANHQYATILVGTGSETPQKDVMMGTLIVMMDVPLSVLLSMGIPAQQLFQIFVLEFAEMG